MFRRSSRLIVDGDRPSCLEISRIDKPSRRRTASRSRSRRERYRVCRSASRIRSGATPPRSARHRNPVGRAIPIRLAASIGPTPARINFQYSSSTLSHLYVHVVPRFSHSEFWWSVATRPRTRRASRVRVFGPLVPITRFNPPLRTLSFSTTSNPSSLSLVPLFFLLLSPPFLPVSPCTPTFQPPSGTNGECGRLERT